MLRTRTVLTASLAAAVLTACGGGGGDDPPADDDFVVPAPITQTPVITQPDALVDPQPPQAVSRLEGLFGRVRVSASFTGVQGSGLAVDASFNQSSVANPSGTPVVVDLNATLSTDAASIPNTITFGCSIVESTGQVICNSPLPEGSALYFVFATPASGQADGLFEFCESGTDTAACVNDLLATPDGPASLTITPSAARRSANRLDGPSQAPYLAYADQGVPAAEPAAINSETFGAVLSTARAVSAVPLD